MTFDTVKDLSKRLRRASGVAHYHPHALRHTYATRLLRAKVPIEVVSPNSSATRPSRSPRTRTRT